MKIRLGVLADYANTTAEGKLNIMGIFSRIQSASFPARHSQCHLVISCTVNEFDVGKTYPHRIRLIDANGKALMELKGQVSVHNAIDMNLVMCVNDMVIPKAGDYEFLIDIGDSQSWPVPFSVTKIG